MALFSAPSISSSIWIGPSYAQDPVAQEALLEGCRLMSMDRRAGMGQALAQFELVVQRCPTYAEVRGGCSFGPLPMCASVSPLPRS